MVEDTKQAKRNMGLDALRIVSMIMILFLHILGKSELLGTKNNSTIYYILYYIIESLCIVAVNCYVLVSGYFLIKSEFKWKKVLKIYGETLFYSIFIFIIVILLKKQEFRINLLMRSFFPIITKEYWFINYYLLMYILSPYINKFIYALKQEEFKKLLVIVIIAFSIWNILPNEYTFDSSSGYGIIWFTCLYMIASYTRLYGWKWEYKINSKRCLLIYIGMGILITLLMILLDNICFSIGRETVRGKFLEYNNFLVLIESLSLFLYFKNLKINNKGINKIITLVAPLTLAVYLIHEQYALSKVLYKDILKISICYHNNYSIFIIIGYVMILFSVCVLIEYIRQKIIKVYIKRKNLNEA